MAMDEMIYVNGHWGLVVVIAYEHQTEIVYMNTSHSLTSRKVQVGAKEKSPSRTTD